MNLIDTHCHLDFPQFDGDRAQVIERARAAGVRTLINIGSSLKGSEDAVRLSAEFPRLFAAVGIHPHDADDYTRGQYERIAGLAETETVVAIGEIGLDYYKNYSLQDNQRRMFAEFLKLSLERALPVIVHSRQAPDDTLAMLREQGIERAVIHCFSGDESFLTRTLDAGYFVSYTCNITYRNAQGLRDLVKITPLERMFLETDAPFLSPENKRGKRNEPAAVAALCDTIAALKGLDSQTVAARTSEAATAFFCL